MEYTHLYNFAGMSQIHLITLFLTTGERNTQRQSLFPEISECCNKNAGGV